ncbi:MAG: adenosylcobinamide-GDP ribazoletransferase [Halobacteriota archaeon]|uniref:adenosylcobinamide-GDP ribazoletransferase n=1 Tax=Natronomonas sp. TaxID=2184060 RepID=UPI0039770117
MALNTVAGGIRGAIAFLTRLPIASGADDWERFRAFPAAFPIVAYLVGALAALPFVLGFPTPTAAFAYLAVLVALVGIPHLDGAADLGDAMAAHGAEETIQALKDTETGVGAIVAVVLVVSGLVLAGLTLSTLPLAAAVGLVVAAEVGAKLGMATVACLGTAAHEGLGSAFTESADSQLLLGPIIVALPAAFLAPLPAGLAAVAVGPLVAILLIRWANRSIGGVNGDVFGATNELARVLALHVGVIAWTLW